MLQSSSSQRGKTATACADPLASCALRAVPGLFPLFAFSISPVYFTFRPSSIQSIPHSLHFLSVLYRRSSGISFLLLHQSPRSSSSALHPSFPSCRFQSCSSAFESGRNRIVRVPERLNVLSSLRLLCSILIPPNPITPIHCSFCFELSFSNF